MLEDITAKKAENEAKKGLHQLNKEELKRIVSELYENKLRKLTLISGLVLVVLINADFFEIYSSLSRQYIACGKLVAQAELINIQASKMTTQLDAKGRKEIDKVSQEV